MELSNGISVVVPVYNSAETLEELTHRLAQVLPGLSQAQDGQFELILVNDGSRDESWEIITRLASEYRWV
ncbi:MAG: glycosyltransferase, partial [Anaerolineales bacterium]|nr:glycosyltransferase [Anaerolineales bacterium]